MSSLRKQGSKNVTVLMDSRFRGNDRLSYVIIIERFAVALDSKTVSLSKYNKGVLWRYRIGFGLFLSLRLAAA